MTKIRDRDRVGEVIKIQNCISSMLTRYYFEVDDKKWKDMITEIQAQVSKCFFERGTDNNEE